MATTAVPPGSEATLCGSDWPKERVGALFTDTFVRGIMGAKDAEDTTKHAEQVMKPHVGEGATMRNFSNSKGAPAPMYESTVRVLKSRPKFYYTDRFVLPSLTGGLELHMCCVPMNRCITLRIPFLVNIVLDKDFKVVRGEEWPQCGPKFCGASILAFAPSTGGVGFDGSDASADESPYDVRVLTADEAVGIANAALNGEGGSSSRPTSLLADGATYHLYTSAARYTEPLVDALKKKPAAEPPPGACYRNNNGFFHRRGDFLFRFHLNEAKAIVVLEEWDLKLLMGPTKMYFI
jgi:hypothetical protein